MNADSRVSLPEDDQVDLTVEMLRMLADGTRIRLLWCLLDRELSVGELAAAVSKQPAAVSQHLAKLRLARLVTPRREGTTIYYRVENDHVGQLVLDAVRHAEHAGPGIPRHHLAASDVHTLPARSKR
jgi:DNA-binding transcriptional ArsR family regulator